MAAKKKTTTLQAIVDVLGEQPTKAMKVPDIIKAAVPRATELKGKHPGQTVYSVIYSNAKKDNAVVEQVGKGEFRLTALGKKVAKGEAEVPTGRVAKAEPAKAEPEKPKRSRASSKTAEATPAEPVVEEQQVEEGAAA